MTITEKIIAAHADIDSVAPGEIVQVRLDMALANDITAPLAIKVFRKIGRGRVFDRKRIVLVADHFVPNKDIPSAQQVKMMRDFASEHGIKHYYEAAEGGVEHVIVPEKGLAGPGDLIIGADSHTCTYGALGAFSTGVGSTDLGVAMATGLAWLRVPATIKIEYSGRLGTWVGGKDLILHTIGILGVEGANYRTLEFAGPAIGSLPMADRFTMCNMAIEAGAKNGIIEPDSITAAYIRERGISESRYVKGDRDASFERIVKIDVSALEPQVAFPHSPANVRPVSEAGVIPLDQVFIGSCTNGRLEDLETAASLLKGKKVAKGLRLIVLPGSSLVFREAIAKGIIEILAEAGAVVGPPCCGPCLGGHMGILAEGERAISTSNRNFQGRMGHFKSEVFLASPATAAASAVLGRIASPLEL
jgi:3-isopropylmalate/(R)-2-methylmalate dehydratase large subunit